MFFSFVMCTTFDYNISASVRHYATIANICMSVIELSYSSLFFLFIIIIIIIIIHRLYIRILLLTGSSSRAALIYVLDVSAVRIIYTSAARSGISQLFRRKYWDNQYIGRNLVVRETRAVMRDPNVSNIFTASIHRREDKRKLRKESEHENFLWRRVYIQNCRSGYIDSDTALMICECLYACIAVHNCVRQSMVVGECIVKQLSQSRGRLADALTWSVQSLPNSQIPRSRVARDNSCARETTTTTRTTLTPRLMIEEREDNDSNDDDCVRNSYNIRTDIHPRAQLQKKSHPSPEPTPTSFIEALRIVRSCTLSKLRTTVYVFRDTA
ncbi:unnamed protein product [Trichogramma brassicae]|uniref:Uncharacterized protein n=1 Tax=Trichogramma brassicae TaxID=86971 RepID=A0A6H5ING6_9HYME|nr:unnamed protein product [Trichogramma brassicae]